MAYGWEGKGNTIHLLTEGNCLPLAFLVAAANIAEVAVGLKVVDQVRVPRPQGRPKQLPACLAADKGYDSADPDSIGTATADSTLYTLPPMA
jgi:hypothetical protein